MYAKSFAAVVAVSALFSVAFAQQQQQHEQQQIGQRYSNFYDVRSFPPSRPRPPIGCGSRTGP